MIENKPITLSTGTDFGKVKKTEATWEKLSAGLTTHKQADKKGGAYFVGGYFKGERRKEADLVAMTLLALDIDKLDMPVEEVELSLIMDIENAFCAYSTYSHGVDDKTSVRVVLPLSREVTPDEYRQLSRAFGETVSLSLDECSFKPNQAMFMPTCPDVSNAWSMIQGGAPVDVDEYLKNLPVVVEDNADGDDLESMLAEQPLDLEPEEIDAYLLAYPADGLEYDQWLMVGAALNHQFGGSKAGFDTWVDWSAKSPKHDDSQMKMKWRSFGNSTKVVTFASVIFHVRESGGLAVGGAGGETLEALLEEADTIVALDQYQDFKTRIAKMPDIVLQSDHRAMLAARLAKSFGKVEGITKTDIKAALAHKKRHKEAGDAPEWLEPWVYVESTCEFHNKELHYAIKREAFNAKFDREMDCIIAEKSAAQLGLVDHKMPTVVDTMFFPGAGQMFESDGKTMLNSFVSQGIQPCQSLDKDGQACVDVFLKHVEFTIESPKEREILLDWLCYVVQNPGQRVNWALLLQGAQGTGKTYFVNVLQQVLGTNVKNLDPTSIAGRFTGWAHGALVNAVEEIRISGTNKYEVLDRMKPFITNDTVMIEEKGRDHRTVPNFTSYFLLTNHVDAIPLIEGDRRYCVLFSRVQSEAQLYRELGGREGAEDYFDTLFDSLARRPDALAYYLKTRKLSAGFVAWGRAPDTSAREAMINMAISPEREMLEDAITMHECDVINENVLDVTWLNELCEIEGTHLPNGRATSAILLEMGYRRINDRKIKIAKNRKNHYVWFGARNDEKSARDAVKNFHDGDGFEGL
jgi:hypothetical protein